MAAPEKAMVGKVLKGQYRIEGVLGQGAMGVVYRGTQTELGKPVAIKMLLSEGYPSQDALDRFKREAAVASKLVHPGVPQVFDFGIEADAPFLAMEFIEGKELAEILEDGGPWTPARALTLMRQLTSVLEEAHRLKLIHRDVKPSNLLLTRYTKDGPIYLKVLDFGIAKQVGLGHGKLTATGAIIGTPMYMSPEQAEGEVKQIDSRTDQYSAGVVLYELLAGHPPFQDENAAGLMFSHMHRPPPPLPESVPAALREVVMRMLSKKPADRYANPKALDSALAACEKDCRDAPSAPRVRRWLPTSGILASSLAALGLTSTNTLAATPARDAPTGTLSADWQRSSAEHARVGSQRRRLILAIGGALVLAVLIALLYAFSGKPAGAAAADQDGAANHATAPSGKSAKDAPPAPASTSHKKTRSSH